MKNFNSLTSAFRLNEPDTYPRNLRGATIGQSEESYLFLLCAYDYVYNPDTADKKLIFIWNYFLKKPKSANSNQIAFETEWFLNIGAAYTEELEALLVNPTVMVSMENKAFNMVPVPPGASPARSAATGNPSFAATEALNGGVFLGGVANYNLFTKAIDIACGGIGNMITSIAETIKTHRDKSIDGANRTRLVERYTTMATYYNDQTLTKFGLIYR